MYQQLQVEIHHDLFVFCSNEQVDFGCQVNPLILIHIQSEKVVLGDIEVCAEPKKRKKIGSQDFQSEDFSLFHLDLDDLPNIDLLSFQTLKVG